MHRGSDDSSKFVFYNYSGTPWTIKTVPTANRFGIYAPRAGTAAPIQIIDLTDYVDATPPILGFGGGNTATGFPHYWGINIDITTAPWYSSSFAVKQYSNNPYASTIVDSSDKVVSGFNQLGGAYFSGSVTIGDILTLPFQSPLPSSKPTGSVALSGSGGTFVGMYVYNGTNWVNVKT